MGMILEWTNYPMMFFFLAITGVMNFLYFCYTIGKKRKRSVGWRMGGRKKE